MQINLERINGSQKTNALEKIPQQSRILIVVEIGKRELLSGL